MFRKSHTMSRNETGNYRYLRTHSRFFSTVAGGATESKTLHKKKLSLVVFWLLTVTRKKKKKKPARPESKPVVPNWTLGADRGIYYHLCMYTIKSKIQFISVDLLTTDYFSIEKKKKMMGIYEFQYLINAEMRFYKLELIRYLSMWTK